MTRRLPRCATCGASLAHKARAVIHYQDLPGQPMVGFCMEHADQLQPWEYDTRTEGRLVAMLMKLAEKDQLRVVAGPAWSRAHPT